MRGLIFAAGIAFAASTAIAATPAPAPTPAPVAATPAPATPPAPPPLPPRPNPFVAPDLNYVRVGEVDIGRWQYVNVPAGRADGLVQTWRIDVFTIELPTPKGRGAYSVTLYEYDCRARLYRVDHTELFNAAKVSIDRFDGPPGYNPPARGADEDIRQACGQLAYDGAPLKGLTAVLADAKKAAGR